MGTTSYICICAVNSHYFRPCNITLMDRIIRARAILDVLLLMHCETNDDLKTTLVLWLCENAHMVCFFNISTHARVRSATESNHIYVIRRLFQRIYKCQPSGRSKLGELVHHWRLPSVEKVVLCCFHELQPTENVLCLSVWVFAFAYAHTHTHIGRDTKKPN